MKSISGIAVHKAGSVVFQKLLSHFAKEAGLAVDPLSRHFSASPLPQAEILRKLEVDIKPEGAFYGVIRSPHFSAMTRLKDLRLIAQVRDPRDCLTSHYFSLAFSHNPPKHPDKRDAFLARRSAVKSMTIDEFVLDSAALFEERFQLVANLWKRHPDMLVCKYETMVERPNEWRADAADFFGLKMTSQLARDLDRLASFNVDREDISRHKRQVTPGDHLRKLKPETINLLNSRFSTLIRTFGYEIAAQLPPTTISKPTLTTVAKHPRRSTSTSSKPISKIRE